MSFTLIIAILLSACGASPPRVTLPDEMPERPPSLRVQVRANGTLAVRDVALEDYVMATILSEVDPPDADERVLEKMFEVQAILSRTYALAYRGRHAREGFDLCSTTHCQLYEPGRVRTSRWSSLARQAATRTRGGTSTRSTRPTTSSAACRCSARSSVSSSAASPSSA
jgi:hypothetical protein